LALLKKKIARLIDGDLKGKYLDQGTKKALVEVITETKENHSVTITYACQKLQLDKKRYQRWVRLNRNTGRYGGRKPGPQKPPHRLLPEEKEDIISLAKDDTYRDLSHRQLAIVASETGQVEASASSFYRVMKKEQLMEKRQRKSRTPQEKPEVKPARPNEIWSWDLTYLALGPLFVYLFAIIDV
jgi:hypothetical protein